jgi:uncharacterized protein (TIGR02391 family)
MAKRSSSASEAKRHSEIPIADVPAAIEKLERRLTEVRSINPPGNESELSRVAGIIATKVNATLADVYGPGTVETEEARVYPMDFQARYSPCPFFEELQFFERGRDQLAAQLQARIEILAEKLQGTTSSSVGRALRAYEGLELHPEILRAVGDLYRNGHYSNAILEAVKALNEFVRYRSGEAIDGTALMQHVFNPTKPVLRFNELADQSDKDEQLGFMMMFTGAVAGLRNPRAHKLIRDNPERALEFIAFVSLLAKLVDGANRAP